jgi:hydrogenase maturation protease
MQVKTDDNLAVKPANSCAEKTKVLVLGLGNILLKDEGIGVHVAQRLQKRKLPDNVDSTGSPQVEVVDGGTAGSDILLSQQSPYKLVVIDAMKTGRKAGTIYKARFKAEEKDKLNCIFGEDKESKISLHQVGLLDALAAAEKINRAPCEITIIGVEPKQVDCGLELTEEVKQKIPAIINTVLEEIKNAVYEK